jgi:type 1 glutamine amidotransferase
MHSFRTEGWNKKDAKATPWFEFTGLPSTGHGPQLPIDLSFVADGGPITKGMQDWTTIKEELYNNTRGGVLPTGKPLIRGKQVVKDRSGNGTQTVENVVAWTNTYGGKAKVFGTTLGHNNETVADARYLDLITRGLLWATDHITDDGKPAAGYEAKK